MKEYISNQYHALRNRVLAPRKFMQMLAGPRQVGKSMIVGQVLEDLLSA